MPLFDSCMCHHKKKISVIRSRHYFRHLWIEVNLLIEARISPIVSGFYVHEPITIGWLGVFGKKRKSNKSLATIFLFCSKNIVVQPVRESNTNNTIRYEWHVQSVKNKLRWLSSNWMALVLNYGERFCQQYFGVGTLLFPKNNKLFNAFFGFWCIDWGEHRMDSGIQLM